MSGRPGAAAGRRSSSPQEIDALAEGSQTPGSIPRKPLVDGAPGHMEGHNTHAGVAMGALFALKKVMEQHKLPGTISLSFGPAEEQLASGPFLVLAGYLKDVDAAIVLHIGDSVTTSYPIRPARPDAIFPA